MSKPDLTNGIWASTGASIDPGGAKTIIGWIAEIPPHQTQNWWQERSDEFIFHVNEEGLPEWDVATDYPVDAWQKGSDGNVYVSLQTPNINQDPISEPTFWELLSVNLGIGAGGGGFGSNDNLQSGDYAITAANDQYGSDNDITVVYTGTGGHTFTNDDSANLVAGDYVFIEHRGAGLLTMDLDNSSDRFGPLALGRTTIGLTPGDVIRLQLTGTANVWRVG